MKKLLLLVLGGMLSLTLSAQITIERSVIGALGSELGAGDLSLSATAGETAVTTLVTTGLVLTQGFQQPEPEQLTAVYALTEYLAELAVFPNPVRGDAELRIGAAAAMTGKIVVVDARGRQLSRQNVILRPGETQTVRLRTAALPAGTYFLRLLSDNQRLVASSRLLKL